MAWLVSKDRSGQRGRRGDIYSKNILKISKNISRLCRANPPRRWKLRLVGVRSVWSDRSIKLNFYFYSSDTRGRSPKPNQALLISVNIQAYISG